MNLECRVAVGSLDEDGSGFNRPDRTGVHLVDGFSDLHLPLNHQYLLALFVEDSVSLKNKSLVLFPT